MNEIYDIINSNNSVNNKPNIKKMDYWKSIEELKWYWLSKKNNNVNPNDELAERLVSKYTLEEIVDLHNFVVKQRIKLQYFLIGYYKSSPKEFKSIFKLSDDGVWDLSSHIVGLGEIMYNYVLDHPEIVLELQKDYTENFEYGFDKAIFMLQEEI